MKLFCIAGLLFFIITIKHANAQFSPIYYQSNYIRVVQPDVDDPASLTVNYSDPKAKMDTLLNPFTGGLNNPTFFNVDFNGDSIQDLYVFDREAAENQFLLFQGASKKKSFSYRYAPQYHYAFPQQATKWVEFADYNKDGLPDLFTHSRNCSTCIQVNKNTSYLDKSSGKYVTQFKKVTDTLFYYDSVGNRSEIDIANSSNPQFIDVDKDGHLDILAWDIYFTSIQFYRNRDMGKDSLSFWYTKKCWGYFTEVNPHFYQKYTCELDSVHKPVWTGTYDPDPAYKRLHSSGQHGSFALCAFDVDCDGDIDLLLGDGFNDSLAFLENGNIVRGQKHNGYGYDTMINLFPSNNQYPLGDPCVIATMPTPSLVDINNDSLNDLVVAAGQPTDKDSFISDRIHNIWYYYNSGNKASSSNGAANVFNLTTKDFLQNTMIDWGINSAPCFIDVDNDGRKDLIVAVKDGGNGKGFSHLILYLNKPGKTPVSKPYLLFQTDDYLGFSKLSKDIHWPVPAAYLNTKDSKTDLLVGNDSGQVMYFKNEGSTGGNLANFHLSTTALKYISHPSGKLMPINVGGANSAPTAADINDDGKMDLIIGSDYGNISYYRCLGFTGPDNVPYFDSVTSFFGGLNAASGAERQTAPCVADMDKDGKLDMLIGDEIGNLWYFHDFDTVGTLLKKNKILVWDNGANKVDSNKVLSTYIIPAVGDLDNDTFPDIMIGCRRGGLVFLGSANNGFESLHNSGIEVTIPGKKIEIALFPNPAKDLFRIAYQNPENQENATVIVTDILGRRILSHPFILQNGKGDEPISTKEFANGIYIVALCTVDRLIFSNKLIIEK